MIFLLMMAFHNSGAQHYSSFVPGEIWKDTQGKPIHAHGGGIMFHNGIYYWYGEYKKGPTTRVESVTSWEDYRVDAGGISCYSSKDLVNWRYEGIALKTTAEDTSSDLFTGRVVERPKVVYNDRTHQGH